MKSKVLYNTFLLIHLLVISLSAQEKKVAPTSLELYKEMECADSTIFRAFNSQNMEKFKSMFTDDLEWFQDNGGLIPYKTVFKILEIPLTMKTNLAGNLLKAA